MLATGLPFIFVSRQLGHANLKVTARAHVGLLADSRLDEAAAAFAGPGFWPTDAIGHEDHDAGQKLPAGHIAHTPTIPPHVDSAPVRSEPALDVRSTVRPRSTGRRATRP